MTRLSTAVKACIASAALGAMVASPASSEEGDVRRTDGERLLQSQARLAAVLSDALAKDRPDRNIIVSPASVAGTLTAIDLGGEARMHDAVAQANIAALRAFDRYSKLRQRTQTASVTERASKLTPTIIVEEGRRHKRSGRQRAPELT